MDIIQKIKDKICSFMIEEKMYVVDQLEANNIEYEETINSKELDREFVEDFVSCLIGEEKTLKEFLGNEIYDSCEFKEFYKDLQIRKMKHFN